MSIYATLWHLKFPRHGDAHTGCEWVDVLAQAVPGHVGSPTPGHGFEAGDPYADFLPPALEAGTDDADAPYRAVVIVRAGTPKVGQRYTDPLLVLSGEEYSQSSFEALLDRIGGALRGDRPRVTMEASDPGGVRVFFEDGSSRLVTPDELEIRHDRGESRE